MSFGFHYPIVCSCGHFNLVAFDYIYMMPPFVKVIVFLENVAKYNVTQLFLCLIK